MMKKQYQPYIFVAAIFLIIVSPALLSNGMFMDGLLYSVISKNLAAGLGSFWDLHLTSTIYPHFHEHPPLALGLEAIFFKVLGNGILTERIYSLTTFLITAIIIVKIIKLLKPDSNTTYNWLALFFWISVPTVIWAVSNNMLENTMMIFTSLSVLFAIKSLKGKKILNIILSGFMLFLGFLCKGFTALFPLSLFFWLFVFDKDFRFKQFFFGTLIMSVTIALSFGLMFLIFPESLDSLTMYFNKQVLGSVESVKTVDSRFFIVKQLFLDLIPMILISCIFYLLSRKTKKQKPEMIWIWVLIAIGISGVLPIMISMKQRSFYILTTFPFFAVAFSLLIAPSAESVLTKIKNLLVKKLFLYFSVLLLIVGLGLNIYNIGKTNRDKEKINDIYRITEIVPQNTVISVHKTFGSDWAMHGYFHRFAGISLDRSREYKCQYLIVPKGFTSPELMAFDKQSANLTLYDLYKRKN